MFRLKLLPLNKQYRSPANPAYLRDRRGVNVRVYVDFTPMETRIAVVAWGIFIAISAVMLHRLEDSTKGWVFASAFIFALIGGGVLVFARRIASGNIYLVAPGEAFPVIDPFRVGEPRADGQIEADSKRFRYQTDEHEFHFVVKETEPNATERLQSYTSPGSGRTMQFENIEQALPDLLEDNARYYPQAARVSKALVDGDRRRRDIWPVVRLVLGRVLYQRPPTGNFNRAIGEEAQRPPQKGAHLHFAYKLHLLPVGYWFLMNAVAFVLPHLYDAASKSISVFLSILPVMWAFWVIQFHHPQVIARWKRWLSASGHRPLGKLPLYLHVPHNDARHRWEELDEHDFRAYVDEYILDSERMFNIVIGSFSVTSFAVFQLIG